jgi:hypothetical protein
MFFLLFFACVLKDPDPDPDPYKIMTDSDPGGSKTYGFGSTTLLKSIIVPTLSGFSWTMDILIQYRYCHEALRIQFRNELLVL